MTILLALVGMPLFDAVCNALATISAGGFSPNSQSIMGYHNPTITWIVLIFMFFAGSSFNLQYKVFQKRNPLLFFKSEEFRFYLYVVLIMSGLITIVLVGDHDYNAIDAVRHSLFQVVSLMTSTGSASVDFVDWSFSAKILLFITMFFGSCASSAGGGIKMTRWIIIYKSMKSELVRILHPNAILNIKVDEKTVAPEIARQIIVFVCFYLFIFAVGAVIISIIEQNATIGLTSSITAIGNIGPGFGKLVGPMGSFAEISNLSKAIMIIWMLVGRLELIPFLVMLQKDFWTIKK